MLSVLIYVDIGIAVIWLLTIVLFIKTVKSTNVSRKEKIYNILYMYVALMVFVNFDDPRLETNPELRQKKEEKLMQIVRSLTKQFYFIGLGIFILGILLLFSDDKIASFFSLFIFVPIPILFGIYLNFFIYLTEQMKRNVPSKLNWLQFFWA